MRNVWHNWVQVIGNARVLLVLFGAITGLSLSGCVSYVAYQPKGGSPLRVARNAQIEIPTQTQIIGLTEALGMTMAMTPNTGAVVGAVGSALENSNPSVVPVPVERIERAFRDTFFGGLRNDPRFVFVEPSQAEATFHFKLNPLVSVNSKTHREIAVDLLSHSELVGPNKQILWRFWSTHRHFRSRQRHDPDKVRTDAEFRDGLLEAAAQKVATENLEHLRSGR